jgi:hypothetical protein
MLNYTEFKNVSAMTSLISGRIHDYDTFKTKTSDCLLIAFDTEFTKNLRSSDITVSEIGLTLTTSSHNLSLPSNGTLEEFYNRNLNKINTHDIQVKNLQKSKNRENTMGAVTTVQSDELVAEAIKLITDAKTRNPNRGVILTGFDLRVEFRWMAQQGPKLAAIFDGWFDLQDIVMDRAECWRQPSLKNCLKGMNLEHNDTFQDWQLQHRASNDTVRCLALLTGLLVNTERFPQIWNPTSTPELTSHIPLLVAHQWCAVRMTEWHLGPLPRELNAKTLAVNLLSKGYRPTAICVDQSGFQNFNYNCAPSVPSCVVLLRSRDEVARFVCEWSGSKYSELVCLEFLDQDIGMWKEVPQEYPASIKTGVAPSLKGLNITDKVTPAPTSLQYVCALEGLLEACRIENNESNTICT